MDLVDIRSADGRHPLAIRADELAIVHAFLDRRVDGPGGLLLLSGAAGCGKNALAYHALRRAAAQGLSVATVEVAPPAALAGVSQTVDDGLFGSAEHEPWHKVVSTPSLDLLYVRELLGFAAMDVVVTAATRRKTKLISTVHTNDAVGTITRLISAGVDTWKVASAVKLSHAQRRLPRLCAACSVDVKAPASVFEPQAMKRPDAVRRAAGCDACGGTGHVGSVLACEQLIIDAETAEVITNASAAEATRHVREGGVKTLRVKALELVAAGVVSVESALLYTAA